MPLLTASGDDAAFAGDGVYHTTIASFSYSTCCQQDVLGDPFGCGTYFPNEASFFNDIFLDYDEPPVYDSAYASIHVSPEASFERNTDSASTCLALETSFEPAAKIGSTGVSPKPSIKPGEESTPTTALSYYLLEYPTENASTASPDQPFENSEIDKASITINTPDLVSPLEPSSQEDFIIILGDIKAKVVKMEELPAAIKANKKVKSEDKRVFLTCHESPYAGFSSLFADGAAAEAYRNAGRYTAYAKSAQFDMVKYHQRDYWVQKIFEAVLDVSSLSDGSTSVAFKRFVEETYFDLPDLEAFAHLVFDKVMTLHEIGWQYPMSEFNGPRKGQHAVQNIDELKRLDLICQCLGRNKAACIDVTDGGLPLAKLINNPRGHFKQKTNNQTNNVWKQEDLTKAREARVGEGGGKMRKGKKRTRGEEESESGDEAARAALVKKAARIAASIEDSGFFGYVNGTTPQTP